MALTVIDKLLIRAEEPINADCKVWLTDSDNRIFTFTIFGNGNVYYSLEEPYLTRAFEKFDEVKEYFEEICLKPQTAVVKTLPRVVKSVQPFYPPAA